MPTDTSAGPMPRFQAQNAIATNATMQVRSAQQHRSEITEPRRINNLWKTSFHTYFGCRKRVCSREISEEARAIPVPEHIVILRR